MKKVLRPMPILAILLAVVGLVVILELTDVTHIFHSEKTPPASSANSNTKGEPATGTDTSTESNGSQPGDEKSSPGGGDTTSADILAPTGNFVNNHHPNLSGSPAPNDMQSACTTTPGATCKIEFSKDGVTKTLAAQSTDRGGSAFWAWKLQDIGLTQGSWRITATATLNGSSKSSSDSLNLEVSP